MSMTAPDLSTRPPQLDVPGSDLSATIAQIEARGGRPTGMARTPGQPGLWKVSVWWPDAQTALPGTPQAAEEAAA